jgi:hypothetical protein
LLRKVVSLEVERLYTLLPKKKAKLVAGRLVFSKMIGHSKQTRVDPRDSQPPVRAF